MTTQVDAAPAAPTRQDDEDTFNAKMEAKMAWEEVWPAQFNSAVATLAAATAGFTSATSATAWTLATESKTFALAEAGKLFPLGATVKIAHGADATKWALGDVTVFDGTNLTVNVTSLSGSGGPWADWTISVSAPTVTVGDHAVELQDGNGHGTTNAAIRRFTTTVTNTGTAITYADSATDGASFTINEDGVYELEWQDVCSVSTFAGFSLNTTNGGTNINAIPAGERIAWVVTQSVAYRFRVTTLARLSAGGVVRPHGSGSETATDDGCRFSIRKVLV